MALSPVSRSCVSSPSFQRASGVERPANGGPSATGSRQLEPLRQLLQMDGFDGPQGAAKGNGVEALAQNFARLAQLLTDVTRVLGAEGAQRPQGGASPAADVKGLNAASLGRGVDRFDSAPAAAPATAAAPAAPVAPVAAAAPTAPSAPAAASAAPQNKPVASVGDSQGVPKNGNTITFKNDGTTPMTIKFTPNAGEKELDSITLEPGKTQTVPFPENWSGNFRSTSGDGSAATLGEVKFDGGFGKTYYDVSYIEGHNASMTMQPEEGGRVSGTHDDLLSAAPDAIKARNADGSVYGIKKSTTSNVLDSNVVDFYRKHVGADEGYVIPTDDASTLGSSDKNLVVSMKNLV
ncbi:hypothetical protein A176_005346 [Myxococcus hansupus]|uniref:Uncharacterized protein n=1 Tax=Pseudomyxococcus hansupus TaxID=1297742 RepID=A0A0H4X015_9BACT|nr:hypothetical protein [Myxococcus hansupus]AKQ68434.1 hypothetical protein A176_005346 [Myxococcus hansupus]